LVRIFQFCSIATAKRQLRTPLSVAVDLLSDHRPHDVDADDVLESVVVQRIGQARRSATNLRNLVRTFQIFHQYTAEFAKFAVHSIPFGQHIMPTYGNPICGLFSTNAYILLELVLSSTKTMVARS
ncbi:hypothetical protein T07_3989, partial [Trichinella nelsoni]